MDADVDDILANAEKGKKKKRINSDRKGKRVELELAKVLNKRFEEILSKHADWGRFSRTVGSGNRWGNANQSLDLLLVTSQEQEDALPGSGF